MTKESFGFGHSCWMQSGSHQAVVGNTMPLPLSSGELQGLYPSPNGPGGFGDPRTKDALSALKTLTVSSA